MLSPKWIIYVTPLPPSLKDHFGRGKAIRSRDDADTVKQMQYEVTGILTA